MADVDLRPMTLGEVLDRTFKLYKSHFWLFAGITAIPPLAMLVIQVTASWMQTEAMRAAQTPGRVPGGSISMLMGAFSGMMIFMIVYFVLLGYSQAATVFAVSDLYLGRSASIGGSYRRVGAKAFRVLAVLALVGLAVGVGFILLIIPGIILLCRTAVSVPAAMLENTKSVRSIERSMELTKGNAGQIFLIFLLVWVLSYTVAIVFELPFTMAEANALRLHQTLSFGMLFLQHLAAFIAQVLVGPIGTIAFSLMYYNLRVRKEAFDIQHLMASLGSAPSAA
jgi:hypothetical protein